MAEKNGTSFPEIPLGKFLGVSVGVFAGIGILVNSLVLFVILISQRKPQRKVRPYTYLMSHLAFADLLCSIVLVPYVPLELNSHDWLYDETSCQFIYPMITFLTNLAIGTILIITVERFRGVIYVHYSQWTQRNVSVGLFFVWIISFVLIVPNSLKLKVTEYDNINYCNEIWESETIRKGYGFSFFALAFALPLVIIIVMHLIIIVKLYTPELRPDNFSAWQQKQNKRTTRVLSAIILAFFFCVSPNKILYFVWDVAPHLEKSMKSNARLYMRTFQWVYYARVAIDPLIYCFLDTRFKKDLKNVDRRMRGMSITDSEYIRSRSASQRAGTILSVRSRANSGFIDDFTNINDILKPTSCMNCIHEMEERSSVDIQDGECNIKRSRSYTTETELSARTNDSASPPETSALKN